MSAPETKSARAIAAEVLHRFDPARDYAGPILDELLGRTEERQRATDLVYGTIRNLYAIDAVIAQFAGRLPARIAPKLLSIIRVGVYELIYSPATPAYSIVNEAASNAKRGGGRKQTGFVNAVLRQVVRHIANRQADLTAANARRALVQTPQAGCEFDTDFLPEASTSVAAHLGACFSLPQWLVSEWLDEFGPAQTQAICLACNRRPSLYVRVNPLRTTAEELLHKFEQAGIQAELAPVEKPGSAPDHNVIRITGPHAVTQLPGFSEGSFSVQDLSASRAVRALRPQQDWSILDLCSAPGTKTTQLAEATLDSAQITATDIDAGRLDRVRENVTRLGLKSVTVVPYAQLDQKAGERFDAILLDVPCSNTGVLARRVEARHRVRPKAVASLAATQRDLLKKAAGLVKPGGKICYSTCSIQRMENADVIRAFLADDNRFQLSHEELVLPSSGPFDHDGAYVAVLTRKV